MSQHQRKGSRTIVKDSVKSNHKRSISAKPNAMRQIHQKKLVESAVEVSNNTSVTSSITGTATCQVSVMKSSNLTIEGCFLPVVWSEGGNTQSDHIKPRNNYANVFYPNIPPHDLSRPHYPHAQNKFVAIWITLRRRHPCIFCPALENRWKVEPPPICRAMRGRNLTAYICVAYQSLSPQRPALAKSQFHRECRPNLACRFRKTEEGEDLLQAHSCQNSNDKH